MTVRFNFKRFVPYLMIFSMFLTGCGGKENISTLIPKGKAAAIQLDMMKFSFYLMMLVVAVVVILFVYAIVKYRAKPGDETVPEQVEGNKKLELTWTIIPILLVIVLAIPTVTSTYSVSGVPEGGLKVKVTAHQYWWEIKYPDFGIVTAQELVMPVNEKVSLYMKSEDVIHSFWVPALGGKIDVNPDVENKMWLDAGETGIYQGKCAELCGPSHAFMDFKVRVVTEQEFNQWIADMKEPNPKTQPQMQTAKAQQGAEVFQQNCMACHAVDGTKSSIGPNLKGLADRQVIAGYLEMSHEGIMKWLIDPQEVKEGNRMPRPVEDLGLTEKDLEALSEYLMTLTLE